MPIDASIPLSIRQAQIEPFDAGRTLAQVGQLRGIQTQQRLADLQLQEAERQSQERQGIRGAFRQAVGPDGQLDEGRLIGQLAQVAPERAYAIQQTQWERQGQMLKQRLELIKAGRETRKAEVEATKTELEGLAMANRLISQGAASVRDQASYDANMRYLRSVLPPQYQAAIDEAPTTYDPNFVQRVQLATSDAEQNLKRELADLDARLRIRGQDITQRGQELSAQTTTRGQDLQAETSRRGQDLNAETARIRQETGGQVIEGEQGFLTVNPVTRRVEPVLDPASGGQLRGKPTEGQAAAFGFGLRAKDAQTLLKNLEAKGLAQISLSERAALNAPLGNLLLSSERQQYEQAKRNFISAVLRKESGAAIAETEFRNEDSKYFPQIGDKEQVIEQKTRARELAIRVLERQAGRDIPAQEAAQPPNAKPLTDATIDATLRGLQARGVNATRQQVIDALRQQGYQ